MDKVLELMSKRKLQKHCLRINVAQPEDIKIKIDETINSKISDPKNISQVGIRLLKFCQLYDMKRMMDTIQTYAEPFQARYIK